VFVEERSEEPVVLGEDERVLVAEPLQQARRAFDVAEEEGDGSSGEFVCHGCSSLGTRWQEDAGPGRG